MHNRYRISGNGNPLFEKVVKALNLLQEYGVEFNTLTVINDQNWPKGRETYLALEQLGSTYMQFIPIVERHTNTIISNRFFSTIRRLWAISRGCLS